MPLISTSDWASIPGIVCAAPTVQVYDVAYAERLIEERDRVTVDASRFEPGTYFARRLAADAWETRKPWWLRF